jgi:hypothetical protein
MNFEVSTDFEDEKIFPDLTVYNSIGLGFPARLLDRLFIGKRIKNIFEYRRIALSSLSRE